jgi:hypothetical protein
MRFRRDLLVPLLAGLRALPLAACSSDVSTGGAGGAGGAECASFLPPETPPWTPVTVRFTNTHKTPYYLVGGGGCSGDAFSITDAGGKTLPSTSGACGLTCAALQTSSCVCAADCALSPIIFIAPGGTLSVTWPGSIFTETTMPAGCFDNAMCADKCLTEGAPTGNLTFTASLWTSVEGCDPAQCMCAPDAAGSCPINGPATVAGTELKATAPFAAGTDTSVDIAF